ncbi:DEAD/DEAH box helicase family protein [bacterium]|nr:DEAD/DEAH box helicase family protein [bacterium]NUN46330.1 DEAD/DEAH box helicase family protein [bacterium]
MSNLIRFKFDPNQSHQKTAVDSVLKLFDGLSDHANGFQMGADVVPNMPEGHALDESFVFDNLVAIQNSNEVPRNMTLDVDEGLVLDGVGSDSWRYPSFTIEMETGTGKTYAYLRTIHELRKNFGFRKFVIVVPSIAIYEGVIKSFQITREHFKTLYSNETVHLIEYDGQQISKLRGFATSSFTEILIITVDSFNKSSNVIFKPTEKLPGEWRPYQYIQETRPILILDEAQNYLSQKSKEALRTLHPLFALRYSATPVEKPNLIYRLSPVDAFKMNLVKRIQVYGIREEENLNEGQTSLALQSIRYSSGLKAKLRLMIIEKGLKREKELEVEKDDDLFRKTKNESHRGIVVDEIDKKNGVVVFSNGQRLLLNEPGEVNLSREEIFRIQIEETIKQHMQRQAELANKKIKVLTLFFIDRVANYTEENGLIRLLFDKAFHRLRKGNSFFENLKPEDVRQAYFAKKATKKGEEIVVDTSIEEEKKTKEEKELEKAAYELIMKDKERLLSFDEKVCFIFAHSALKEGWDNPNVFQICTLNNTQSEMKKRQEIGRGLRLCVDQTGERIQDESVNILTVVANESYENYVSNLQMEYRESGDAVPPSPSNARHGLAKRNDKIYRSKEFREFWEKLSRRTSYDIKVNTKELIEQCVTKLNYADFPEPRISITKGKFVITHICLKLLEVKVKLAKIEIDISDTRGQKTTASRYFDVRDDLSKLAKDERLRGFKILKIIQEGSDSSVEFDNGQKLTRAQPIAWDSTEGQHIDEKTVREAETTYPVFNLIDRAAKETTLTRHTILEIFKQMKEAKKKLIFRNPEGFAGVFITIIRDMLADHIAGNIEYAVNNAPQNESIDEIFPPTKKYVQKELMNGTKTSLYDVIQFDSDVERRFVENRVMPDDEYGKILCYFKFPGNFKIGLPKIIGNYNPDWGIIRLSEDGKYKLQLVRETKGNMDPNLLQFKNEKRKIDCAKKHFKIIGVDYRQVTDEKPFKWWESEEIS